MPICQMQTNFKWNSDKRSAFLAETAEALSEILEKPLPAVMVMMTDTHMHMNKSEDTVFFAEFRYVKNFASPAAKAEFLEFFADRMLSLIQKYTFVDTYRNYMQFTEMTRSLLYGTTPFDMEFVLKRMDAIKTMSALLLVSRASLISSPSTTAE